MVSHIQSIDEHNTRETSCKRLLRARWRSRLIVMVRMLLRVCMAGLVYCGTAEKRICACLHLSGLGFLIFELYVAPVTAC